MLTPEVFKKRCISILLLLICFSPGNLNSQDLVAASKNEALVEYPGLVNDAHNPCISAGEYQILNEQCAENCKRLGLTKNVTLNTVSTSLIWPVRPAGNLNDCGYYFIGAYVDQNTAAGAIKDFNCGTNTYDTHRGTDIAIWPYGFYKMDNSQVAVIAAAAGTIIQRADGNFDRNCSSNNLTANSIIIQHADGSQAFYWHMKKNSVTSKTVGQTVVAGEFLGMVGSSGSASGPHLHFEVHSGATAASYQDPFSGACNTLNANSWWAMQPAYLNPTVIKVSVNTTDVVFPACPATETLNESDAFLIPFQGPGLTAGYAKFYSFLRDATKGSTIDFKILNPDGSTFNSWSYTIATFYKASYVGFSKLLPVLPGTYRFQSIYNGVICEKKFEIITQALLAAISDTLRICDGQNIVLASGYSGNNTWQWQQDMGNGFANITNNSNFSGTLSDTLRISNPPTAWYGYRYRCLVNNVNFSKKYVLRFTSNWTGFTSSAWEIATNWSCGKVPDANTDVKINTGMPYYPVVNANTSCRSVETVGASSMLTIKTGVALTLAGH